MERMHSPDVRVLDDPRQIQFTVRGELPEGRVNILVEKPDGHLIWHFATALPRPPLPVRPAVLKDWNGNPIPNARFGLDLDQLYSGEVAAGEGLYILGMVEDGNGRRTRTYLPVLITADQPEYILQLPRPNVEARVQDHRGVAVPDIRIAVFGLGEDNPLQGSGIDAHADAEGRVRLYLPPGKYRVGPSGTREYLYPEEARFFVGQEGEQVVDVNLLLPNVTGSVRFAAEGGQAARWAILKFRGPGGRHEVRAFEDGRFIAYLPPGQHYLTEVELCARENGVPYYFGDRYPITVTPGTPLAVDVTLPAVNLQGEAAIGGQAVAEGLLIVEPQGSGWKLYAPIENGRWQMYLTEGRYQITGIEVGGKIHARSETITVTADQAANDAVKACIRLFSDVPDDHWARADLEVMAARNIVRGDETGRFNPDGAVTRAEFAALLVRTLGLERVTPAQPSFTDVARTDWFCADVEAAARAGLIQGHAGQFRPRDRISRQEMAVILARALRQRSAAPGLSPGDIEAVFAGLSDRSDIASWARADVALLYRMGMIRGRNGKAYAPQADATRLEAVVALKRLL